MLRVLRVTGIVVFALLLGFSANSLQRMHESGELFEAYNSRLRADLTLAAASVIGVAVLAFFELRRIRQPIRRRSYGRRHHREESAEAVDGLDSDIYASSKPADEWNVRKTRSSKNYSKKRWKQEEGGGFWMGYLKLFCMALPLLYGGLLACSCIHVSEDSWLSTLLPVILSVLLILSVVVLIGIFKKAGWGITFGFLLSICNLVIFPYGTAVGLFLIIGLVGASQHFAVSEKQRARSKSAARSRASAV